MNPKYLQLLDTCKPSLAINEVPANNKIIVANGSVSTTVKKSPVARKKQSRKFTKAQLSKETQWAYFMQAIEPSDKVINDAFTEYHPMWLIQSQKTTISSGQFKFMREHLLNMTVEQCAAYLRVHRTSVNRWENGKSAIPFMVFELLRLVFESANFRLSHQNWQGWFINHEGRLVSPDRAEVSFSPDDLSYVREIHQAKSHFEIEYNRMTAEVMPLKAEIKELKAALGDEGVLLNELKLIENKLSDITSKISSVKVVRLNPKVTVEESFPEAKCA